MVVVREREVVVVGVRGERVVERGVVEVVVEREVVEVVVVVVVVGVVVV